MTFITWSALTCEGDRREQIKGQFPIWLGILDLLEVGGRLEALVVRALVLQGPGLDASAQGVEGPRVHDATVQTELVEGGLDVPHALELAPHPGLLQTRLVLHRVDALGLRVPGGDLGVDGLDTDVVTKQFKHCYVSLPLRLTWRSSWRCEFP